MAPLIAVCAKPLCQLARMHPTHCRKQLRSVPDYLIDGIGECCDNILHGNLNLTKHQIQALKKYKNVIRKVGDPEYPTYARRQILVEQRGGFLPLLLRTVLPFALSYLGERFAR